MCKTNPNFKVEKSRKMLFHSQIITVKHKFSAYTCVKVVPSHPIRFHRIACKIVSFFKNISLVRIRGLIKKVSKLNFFFKSKLLTCTANHLI